MKQSACTNLVVAVILSRVDFNNVRHNNCLTRWCSCTGYSVISHDAHISYVGSQWFVDRDLVVPHFKGLVRLQGTPCGNYCGGGFKNTLVFLCQSSLRTRPYPRQHVLVQQTKWGSTTCGLTPTLLLSLHWTYFVYMSLILVNPSFHLNQLKIHKIQNL